MIPSLYFSRETEKDDVVVWNLNRNIFLSGTNVELFFFDASPMRGKINGASASVV